MKTKLILSALVISVIGYNFWPFAWHGFFYHCNALFIVIVFYLLQSLKIEEKYFNKIATIGFWFSINNLLDEIFFDPTKFGINEYIFAIIVIIITFKKKNNGPDRIEP